VDQKQRTTNVNAWGRGLLMAGLLMMAGNAGAQNQPPTPSQITSPEDGVFILLAGDPEGPFVVEWSESTDPDGDEVNYAWELAMDTSFANVVFFDETETGRLFASNLGLMAGILDNAGITTFPDTLYHHILAFDSDSTTVGPTARIIFDRGTFTASETTQAVPDRYTLFQNYPNPFNPATTIRFDVQQAGHVQVQVFDVRGRLVETLVDGERPAGHYTVTWNAASAPSGVYLYRLQAGRHTEIKEMVLLR
jgi:hypothetical protein